MAGPPGGPLRSPDGLSWWDGAAWQPISTLGALPPAPPAQAPPVPFPEGSPEPQQWPDWLPRTRAAEAVVDEPPGQFQAEVALHGDEGAFDVEAVDRDAVQDGVADLVVVVGLGGTSTGQERKNLRQEQRALYSA